MANDDIKRKFGQSKFLTYIHTITFISIYIHHIISSYVYTPKKTSIFLCLNTCNISPPLATSVLALHRHLSSPMLKQPPGEHERDGSMNGAVYIYIYILFIYLCIYLSIYIYIYIYLYLSIWANLSVLHPQLLVALVHQVALKASLWLLCVLAPPAGSVQVPNNSTICVSKADGYIPPALHPGVGAGLAVKDAA